MRKTLGAAISLLLASALLAPAAAGATPSSGGTGGTTAAQRALHRAERLFAPADPQQRASAVPDRDATLVLRDLAFRLHGLSGPDLATAKRILARPTDGTDPVTGDQYGNGYPNPGDAQMQCTTHFCFHWVPTGTDAPPATDVLPAGAPDGIPDWVTANETVFEQVWATIVGTDGYRAPLSDVTSPDPGSSDPLDAPKVDIYLAELGADRMYGYCTTDDPAGTNLHPYVSAYCVMDNDFAPAQYGGVPALNSLEVTAAHEFFHAVQASYDFAEDLWLMEGSAAWIEDEVYDAINDNLQYLAQSPLKFPGTPVDYAPQDSTYGPYGSWIFWRFLSEYFGPGRGSDPTVVRDVWRRVDANTVANPAAANAYSLQAVKQVTAARGVPFTTAFAAFGAANQMAKRWYTEGATYPSAPLAATITLGKAKPDSGWRGAKLLHLSNINAKLRAAPTLKGAWRLRVFLDLPRTVRGSAATVVVHRKDGSVRSYRARLNSAGDGTVTVPFSRSTVAFAVVTLTNAGTGVKLCGNGTPLSCGGLSLDDNLSFAFRARAIR